jgi:hypothetical protein
VALFLGEIFEDMVASLTWPCTLRPGCRWNGMRSRPVIITLTDVMHGVHHDILYRH